MKKEYSSIFITLLNEEYTWAIIPQMFGALKFLNRDTVEPDWEVQILKHVIVLMVCYSAGLPVSEAAHLRAVDIDSGRM